MTSASRGLLIIAFDCTSAQSRSSTESPGMQAATIRAALTSSGSVAVLLVMLLVKVGRPGLWVAPVPPVGAPDPSSPPLLHNQCQDMFTISRATTDQLWQTERHYEQLSRALPPLLRPADTNSSDAILVTRHSRLHLLRGSVPYIPCQVREYGREELGQCTAARASRGASTWITFVGDSNQRLKIHTFFSFLPPDLLYTYYLGDRKVSVRDFTNAVAHHLYRPLTFDIFGWRRPHPSRGAQHFNMATLPPDLHVPDADGHYVRGNYGDPDFSFSREPLLERAVSGENYELRLTVVWAPGGSETDNPTNRSGEKNVKLLDLLSAGRVPDVVILGYGTWMAAMRVYHDELVAFTELDHLTRPLLEPLTRLASRTTVLLWSQSRYRSVSSEAQTYMRAATEQATYWRSVLLDSQFNDSLPLLDAWQWRTLTRTGVWHWDSTLPFSLANLHDCQWLSHQSGYDIFDEDRWWNCGDDHHSSYETNVVEIQMLLNFLCNSYQHLGREYCCSHPHVPQ